MAYNLSWIEIAVIRYIKIPNVIQKIKVYGTYAEEEALLEL